MCSKSPQNNISQNFFAKPHQKGKFVTEKSGGAPQKFTFKERSSLCIQQIYTSNPKRAQKTRETVLSKNSFLVRFNQNMLRDQRMKGNTYVIFTACYQMRYSQNKVQDHQSRTLAKTTFSSWISAHLDQMTQIDKSTLSFVMQDTNICFQQSSNIKTCRQILFELINKSKN